MRFLLFLCLAGTVASLQVEEIEPAEERKLIDENGIKALISEANVRIGGQSLRQATTPAQDLTTISTESSTTTTTTTTTTENPANFKKSGSVELIVENVVETGNMIHWSREQNYLAISDIWGQKYIRFTENQPETATEAELTNVENENAESRQATTQASITSTGSPLPYQLNTLKIPTDVVFLLHPQERTEGAYPLMIPVKDEYNYTATSNEVIVAFNARFHLVSMDLESPEM